jgi:hypothetical protein
MRKYGALLLAVIGPVFLLNSVFLSDADQILPVSAPTMAALGGAALSLLFLYFWCEIESLRDRLDLRYANAQLIAPVRTMAQRPSKSRSDGRGSQAAARPHTKTDLPARRETDTRRFADRADGFLQRSRIRHPVLFSS